MKGLALNVVVALIIAVIGVFTFIMLITGNLQNAATTIYCNTYVKLVNLIPSVEGPTTPELCVFRTSIKRQDLEGTDNKIVSRKLLAYIISCWKDIENLRIESDYPCYELRLSGRVENVTEENVSRILIREDHCNSIENSDYNCGAKNQIIWDIEGNILSLNETIIADVINNKTVPSQIPVNISMIPNLSSLVKKSELEKYLQEEIPDSICNNLSASPNMTCSYISGVNIVGLNITNLTIGTSEYFSYNTDEILSYLEKTRKIYSPINTQRVLLIKYDYLRKSVMVKG